MQLRKRLLWVMTLALFGFLSIGSLHTASAKPLNDETLAPNTVVSRLIGQSCPAGAKATYQVGTGSYDSWFTTTVSTIPSGGGSCGSGTCSRSASVSTPGSYDRFWVSGNSPVINSASCR